MPRRATLLITDGTWYYFGATNSFR